MRGYFFTWLLCAFASVGFGFTDYTKKMAAKEAVESGIGGYVVFGIVIALLSLPILFLLRVVPEPSARSGVRLFRRLLVGVLCGLLLGGLVGALIAAGGKAEANLFQAFAPVGSLFGLIAGLVDSIALDDQASARGGDDVESDAGGPAS